MFGSCLVLRSGSAATARWSGGADRAATNVSQSTRFGLIVGWFRIPNGDPTTDIPVQPTWNIDRRIAPARTSRDTSESAG